MENGKLTVPEVIELDLNEEHLKSIANDYKHLLEVEIDPKTRKEIGSAINVCGQKRAIVEKARKREKAVALEYGRKVDSEAKRYFAILDEVQNPLTEKRKEYDARIAAEKQAKIDAEHLKNCLEEAYAENERINAELERIAELERKEKELAELKEKREREEREKKIAEEAAQKERERIEREKQAEIDRIEREKQAEIDRLKLEKETREREEKECIEREKKAEEEKKRIEAARPDIEKALKFLDEISFTTPSITTPEISEIIDNFVIEFIKSVEAAKSRLLEIK